MIRCVVDTNVAIVANGRSDPEDPRPPTVSCRMAAVEFLIELLSKGRVVLDLAGEIQTEYRRHLDPRGQPGTGDRFYQVVLHSAPHLVERVDLPRRADGEYDHLPRSLIETGFDPSDRKFAAMARQEGIPVVNATDSDWVEAAATLAAENIQVRHLCGCDKAAWFKT
jgi:hypothetical protein